MRWCKYTVGDLKGIFNGKRQFRMELVRDIPSFLFIGGSKAHIRYFCQPRTCFRCGEEGHEAKSCPNRRCGKCLQLGHGKAVCPNEVRCNLCGEEGHVFGACPTSYSAHVSADVQCEGGTGTPEADSPPSLAAAPGQVEIMTEEDHDLSSDSAMSDGGERAPEPPPKDPPSGEGWFDLCEGEGPESALKRSASGEVSDRGTHHSGTPVPSPRIKKIRSQSEYLV
ncbi:Zinc finger CCHC domain-containing protein 3 [Holothuria leucospilota]|uniref:Zinc finger CCHC domain-containing protein 3 n=1 Tax=Holothuria leucospilota TaxID=206669 RepID=A0A9Q1HC11_HOLLE|nr:Zinc finger CCHC domain-containing protein 3 [Holothuria leucospilota]